MGSKISDAWAAILEENPRILEDVGRSGTCRIKAAEIKKYYEPRLMAKHDCSELVPDALRKAHLNILPVSKSAYVLGDFSPFVQFPRSTPMPMSLFSLSGYDTLRPEEINSEAKAISALSISGILEEFIEEERPVQTVSGRSGSGAFDFFIDRRQGGKVRIDVESAQIEVDAVWETADSIIILEAKNVVHDDFQVRQVYFPFRKFRALGSQKRLRLLFSQYTNLTYQLFEYRFSDPSDFSSVELVKHASFALAAARVTREDIAKVHQCTSPDPGEVKGVPFPQADRIERVVALCEHLKASPAGMSRAEIAASLGVVERQGAYYANAARYLGLCEETGGRILQLTPKGIDFLRNDYRNRILALAGLLFKHQLFHQMYAPVLRTDEVPSSDMVIPVLKRCMPNSKESTLERRAKTVVAWIRYLHERTS